MGEPTFWQILRERVLVFVKCKILQRHEFVQVADDLQICVYCDRDKAVELLEED